MSNKGPVDPDLLSQLLGFAPPAKPSSLFDSLLPVEQTGPAPLSGSLMDALKRALPENAPVLGNALGRSIFAPPVLPTPPPVLPPPEGTLAEMGLFPPVLGRSIFAPPVLPPPPPVRKQPPEWGAEHTKNFLRALLRRRPMFTEGRVLPKLEDLAVMEGRQIEAAFVYTDLDSFTKVVATQPRDQSFVLLQAFIELVTRFTSHYGGAVVDVAGDRVLSVFHRPAKNFSSDPVHEAITAAFWIQTMLPALAHIFAERGILPPRVGIGIDYGSATVGCVGFRNNKRLFFLGDAANNAAKLQDLAGPGETLISIAAFLRRPNYLNRWVVQHEGSHFRVNVYFAQHNEPPEAH
jgi:class 3 adenylate cyclase